MDAHAACNEHAAKNWTGGVNNAVSSPIEDADQEQQAN
jgi:hypothetical protein